ncbi:metal-dependent hydrolase [Desemzia sp. RIT804]|uniref:metal-dependent hydrolase n=1 Tax=Desemzia sp. RIT 804 TaxID=2810209 RepID=UPI00194E4AF9|nr:metal-dependent hydrolase [Desemzia sp. RIT 804]MBM6613604.1 metal-dependent hydrolase [Desemzia sp. RIT 804]
MQYKTHLAVTYAAALPMLVSSDSLTIGNLVVLGVGALFPDIDHPGSFIGKRLPIVSDSMRKLFGHRGIVHSLIGAVFFTAVVRFLLMTFDLPIDWATWFLMGFFAHLVEDSFSKHGIAWLQPIYNKNIQFGLKQVYYTTGGGSELAIFFVASAILIYQIVQIDLFAQLTFPFLEIQNVVNQIKNTYFI